MDENCVEKNRQTLLGIYQKWIERKELVRLFWNIAKKKLDISVHAHPKPDTALLPLGDELLALYKNPHSRAALSVYCVLERVGGMTLSFQGFPVASLLRARRSRL
jgi:hypothetical protein